MSKVIALFPGRKRELGGCEIYRITMPYAHLQSNHPSWEAAWGFYEDIWTKAHLEGFDVWKKLTLRYDIFVFPRIYFKKDADYKIFDDVIDMLHQLNKRIVYEVDDDMTNKNRQVTDGDAIRAATSCDAITVSTPLLSELMESETGRKTYILPNMIAPEVWFTKAKGEFLLKDKIVLGLTGSSTHREDWRILQNVLPKILKDERVHLLLMGFHPLYLEGLPNTTYLEGLPYTKYSQIIQSCDIILAPLNDDTFNNYKSPIKCLEGMAARRKVGNEIGGAACIATDHPVYQLAIKNEKTGLLVKHTEEEWFNGLKELIDNEALRKSMQIEGHQWVQKHHNIAKKSSLWTNAYQAILNKTI